jgi:hypothetical protein
LEKRVEYPTKPNCGHGKSLGLYPTSTEVSRTVSTATRHSSTNRTHPPRGIGLSMEFRVEGRTFPVKIDSANGHEYCRKVRNAIWNYHRLRGGDFGAVGM